MGSMATQAIPLAVTQGQQNPLQKTTPAHIGR